MSPSVVVFFSLLSHSLIKNYEVTKRDIELTEKLSGTDLPTLKCRSTRPKPKKVVDEEVEITDEFVSKNKELELVMDIMSITKKTLLATIDEIMLSKEFFPIPSINDNYIYTGLDVFLGHFDKGGYTIMKIYADREFESLLFRLSDELEVYISGANPNEHVGDIEILNLRIQDNSRTRFYRLPIKVILKVVVDNLAMFTTHALNLFPVKEVVSKYYFLRMIIGRKQLDYKNRFESEFGECVEASQVNTPGNNNLPQMVSSIYLSPSNSI